MNSRNCSAARVNLKVEEVSRPEIQAQLVAEDIADQLSKRAAFRRTLKRTLDTDHGRRRQGREDPVGRAARRCGDVAVRKGDRRLDAAFDAAGENRLRVLRGARPRRETSEFRFGSTKACTRRMAMALMPKRVKHRKSQRGRIRGDASRGNRVVFGDFGLQAEQPGWLPAATIEAGRIAAQQYLRIGGTALHSRLPAQVGHLDPSGNPNGQGEGRARFLGGRRSSRA